jgi:hypothetical protein
VYYILKRKTNTTMADNNLNAYKEYFIKMAKGEIPYSKFYVVNMGKSHTEEPVTVKLVTPTEVAVEQAKVELKTDLQNTIRGSKRVMEDGIYTGHSKRKPPGNKTLNRKPLWN